MKLFTRFLIVASLFLFPMSASAQKDTKAALDSDKAYAEFLKKNPFNKMYPQIIAEAAADYFGQFNKLFAGKPIPSKEARLVAISASAAMRCEYCIYANVIKAKEAGASADEIKAAIQIAAEVARFSTLLYGNNFPQDEFKKLFEQGKPAKKK